MKRLLAVVAAAGALAGVVAQETEDTVLRVDVDLVSVLFSVRDKNKALVPGLTKDDFKVYEEGQEQTIKSFVRETDLPLTIGLLVDVSRSQENLIEVERHAAGQFFQQVLRPKDMAFLISFGAEAELLLSTGIGGLHPGPVPTMSGQKGTILWDAVYLATTEKLQREAGRKVLVVITDGVDVGSRYDARQAIEAAQKADTIIYSIEYSDPRYSGWGGGGDFKRMSEETGGRVYRVDRKHTLQDIFTEIQDEVRSQYALSYTPTNSTKDGSFRKLEIKPTRKDLKVQARRGYYATAARN